MRRDKIYNIYYCSDVKGLQLLKQSIDSIAKNCTSKYKIHCLTVGLDENLIEKFENQFKSYSNINVIVYDCTDMLKGKFDNYDEIAYLTHISNTTMLRMYVNKIINLKKIDKLLYLDTDTYINKDLKELFDINISNYYIGAVRDVHVNWSKDFPHRWDDFYLQRIRKHTYFNGGVEMLNIKNMLKNNIFETLQTFKLEPYMKMTDQDIYNIVFDGHVKYIDLKYNCKWWMNFNKSDMVIIHAAGHKQQARFLKLFAIGIYKKNKFYKDFDYYKELNDYANKQMLEKPKPRTYNIYYCTDSNKFELMKMSITSLAKNSDKGCKYIIHCLSYGMDYDDVEHRLSTINQSNIEIKSYDCTKILDTIGNYSNYSNSNHSISKVTMLRMYIDKIIDLNNIDKILYLDTDTYINKDLEYLFETDLRHKYIGAVRDITVLWGGCWDDHQYYNKYRERGNYFNGGVELLNVKEMLKDNKFEELQLATFDGKEYELADQDIYNEVLGDKVVYLDLYFNYKWWLKEWDFKKIYILHFAGCRKKQQIYMNFLLSGFRNLPHRCKWNLNSYDFKYYNDNNAMLRD